MPSVVKRINFLGQSFLLSLVSFIAVTLFIAAMIPALAAEAQSRFYLTVERSFSPREAAEVRVDFVNAKSH